MTPLGEGRWTGHLPQTTEEMAMKKKIKVTANGWTRSYEIEAELDFAGCSEERLREWAARERVIALQRVLRTRGEAYVAGLGGRLKVNAQDIGAEKAPVEVLVQKLSPEERQRLLALLQQ
jgi:hypothetical protein